MKQKVIFLFVMLASLMSITAQGMCSTQCNVCDRTTFIPRLMAQNSVLELSLYNYNNYYRPSCNDCPTWIDVQIVAPYYFVSTNTKQLARYFLPGCKDSITIGQNNTSDVSSAWLELIRPTSSPYFSTLSLAPRRTVIGGAIGFFIDGQRWSDNSDCWYTHWWASIFIPIEQVRHDFNLEENNSSGPGVFPGIPNAIAALNNPAWLYGKFSPKTLRKFGVDDISIKIGFDSIENQDGHLGFYGQLFVPTGRGTKAHYVFEPLVGSNHVGLGAGFNADLLLCQNENTTIDFMIDARYAYFLKHKERRSMDLYNGDWSRYLLVAEPTETQTPLPGINFFTQEVTVIPASMFELWAALSFNQCNWHAEVGYDFWFRDKERIKVANLDLGVGIFDIGRNPAGPCNVSASCARICQAFGNQPDGPASDVTFVTVKNSKIIDALGTQGHGGNDNESECAVPGECSFLNPNSAAAPRVMTSTVYAAVSVDLCVCCDYAGLIGIGSSYEFAHRRGALNQFGIWLKTAVNF